MSSPGDAGVHATARCAGSGECPSLYDPLQHPKSFILFRLTMRNAVERAWIGRLPSVRGSTDQWESPR